MLRIITVGECRSVDKQTSTEILWMWECEEVIIKEKYLILLGLE